MGGGKNDSQKNQSNDNGPETDRSKQKRPYIAVRPFFVIGSPGTARTCDKRINSPLLYRLSYRGIVKL